MSAAAGCWYWFARLYQNMNEKQSLGKISDDSVANLHPHFAHYL